MVLKRGFCQDSSRPEDSIRESKRRLAKFPSLITEALRGFTPQELVAELEPLVKRVVREEVERALICCLHQSPRLSLDGTKSSGERTWELHFDNKVSSTLFTGSKIVSEDNEPLKVLILDASTKKIITCGPLSSIKIEIVVLNGDFGCDHQEDWTEEDFNSSLVRQREGKRPLLSGNQIITMKDGIGYVGEVSFTDNSSWIRSRKFRIGVRTLRGTDKLKIKEARSEAVVVKDQRGESYKKHHPPYAGDEVWRLEKIAKDGKFHKQLAINGITTVKDFLRLYATDPFALRGVFGGKVTKKTWEIITEHAGKCILDDNKLYCYSATERVGLVLNSVYKVVGATFDGNDFQSLDKLTAPQIQLVEVLKLRAYANLNDWFPVDEQITAGFSRRWLDLPTDSPSNSSLDLQQGNFPVEHQDELEMQLSFNNVTTPSFTFEVGENSQFQFPKAQNSHLASSNILVDGGNSWPSSGALMPVVQAGSMLADDTYRALLSTWLPVTPEWGQGNEFFSTPCSDKGVGMVSSFPNFAIHISQNRRPKVAWCKLRAAVKWGMLARRHVAA